MITTSNTNRMSSPRTLSGGEGVKPQQKELESRPETENILDRYNGSRATGNYVAGAVVGAATETVATLAQSPLLAKEIVENLWQAETIGPNLKILGTLAALPAAALSIPFAPIYGTIEGVSAAFDARKNKIAGELRKDAAPTVAGQLTSKPSTEDAEARTMTGKLIGKLEELGSKKLEEGEKPYDIPLLSPLFAVTGGVVSAAVSGVVGLVAGLVAGTITTGKEMASAFTGEDKSFKERVGQFVAAPLNMVVMGPALGWNGIKEATPRGIADGWKHGPFKPVVDTVKASATIAGNVIKEAWER